MDQSASQLLNIMPEGLLVHRQGEPLFLNRALGEWLGLDPTQPAGSVAQLAPLLEQPVSASAQLVQCPVPGQKIPPPELTCRTFEIEWQGLPAIALLCHPVNFCPIDNMWQKQQTQRVIAEILEVALTPASLQHKLQKALEAILSVSLFQFEQKGSIFLKTSGEDCLELAADLNFSDDLRHQCAKVPFGACICGTTAVERETIFRYHEADDESAAEARGDQHGHFCAPILDQEQLLGVLNIYTPAEVADDDNCKTFLTSVTHALAHMISRQRNDEALTQQRDLLAQVLNHIPHSVFWKNKELVYQGCNANFAKDAGLAEAGAIAGQTDYQLPWDEEQAEHYRQIDQQVLESNQPLLNYQQTMRTAEGKEALVLSSKVPLQDDNGAAIGILGIFTDITEQKELQKRLRHLNLYDQLTGLPNVNLFNDRVKQALVNARRDQQTILVACLDLDNFKKVNNSLGHAAGDEILGKVGQRLTEGLRDYDTIARMSGDSFLLLLPQIRHQEDIPRIIRKVLEVFERPFHHGQQEVFISASMGVSSFPGDGEDPETLVKNADSALHRAKDLGKNCYQLYSPGMNASALMLLNLESSLRKAIESNQFQLYYQPQVDAGSGHLVGAEALVRWIHPELGLVPPGDFIPLAEETGLIVDIGTWVLNQACEQTQALRQQGLNLPRIAVNLSARQFHHHDLIGTVCAALLDTSLPPEALELEITESAVMANPEETFAILDYVREMGVGVAVDDFGTGYSSLSYLKRFPLDLLKIDRSFVMNVVSDPDDATIVKAIIAMAKQLRLKVLAEGVETEEQSEFLREQGCDAMQGYLFSRPLDFEQFKDYMQHAQSALPTTDTAPNPADTTPRT